LKLLRLKLLQDTAPANRGCNLSSAAKELGSATALSVGLIGAAATLFLAGSAIGSAVQMQLQIQLAAESAAIAAADSLRGLATGYPCQVAEQISKQNMANLLECRIVGFEVYIKVNKNALGIVLNAEALAGA